MNQMIPSLLVLLSSGLLVVSASADEKPLAEIFDSPPASTRPSTWWHWMNGNVTKEGITRDLEWMQRIGLAGAVLYEVSHTRLPGAAVHRSEYWQEMIRHAIRECARLGLEFGMNNCSGWSLAGGPWVEPEDSMKLPVFSRSLVAGPLKNPPAPDAPPAGQILPFSGQNFVNRRPDQNLLGHGNERTDYDPYYEDVVVLAYPAPAGSTPPMREMRPTIEPAAAGEAKTLWDGDLDTGIMPQAGRSTDGQYADVVLDFLQPVTARSLSLVVSQGAPGRMQAELAAVAGDGSFETITTFSMPPTGGHLRTFQGVSFPPVTADRFRLRFIGPGNPQADWKLCELELSGAARIESWPVKAGFVRGDGEITHANPPVVAEASQAVPLDMVIDLTEKLRPDGTLDWEVPPGDWTLLRIGTTTIGKMNHPSSVGGLGLEVDKFDSAAIERFLREGVLQMVLDLAGEHAGKTFKKVEIDSWEVGAQNWTGDMVAQFQKRRGYDPLPFLPALSGQIMASAAITERFLRDYRQTCSDLFAEHFYAGFRRFLNPHGIGLTSETYGNVNYNNLQVGGHVDHVMTEFWTGGKRERVEEDMLLAKSMASIANTRGLPKVGAEAFTSMPGDAMWRQHPRLMKSLGDWAFTSGINDFVFHTSTHQPWIHEHPGMSMGPFGINFSRNITWAEQAKAWIDYITRCQAILQSGRSSADVLLLVGEDAPVNLLMADSPPKGFGYDACDPGLLLDHASVENGDIVLKSGMRYKLLVLPDDDRMSVPMAEKIRALVRDGATVLARQKPSRTPGLENYPESDRQLQAVMSDLFGDLDGKETTECAFGQGRILWGPSLAQALSILPIEAAWRVEAAPSSDILTGIHRTTGTEEIFFLASERPEAHRQEVSFRIENGAPEIWHPYDGTRKRAANVRHQNGRTLVTLHFEPDDAFFVVFPEEPTTEKTVHLPTAAPSVLRTLPGPWTVTFQEKRGAPAQATLAELVDLKDHEDDNIKFFSGTATYRMSFDFTPPPQPGDNSRIFLDLGQVEVIAEVRLNGRDLGTLWKYPYRVDITDALRKGENEMAVCVTNLWPNRLIGDARQFPVKNERHWAESGEWPDWLDNPEKPNPTGRITFHPYPYWKATAGLFPSGLIGPVRLLQNPAL